MARLLIYHATFPFLLYFFFLGFPFSLLPPSSFWFCFSFWALVECLFRPQRGDFLKFSVILFMTCLIGFPSSAAQTALATGTCRGSQHTMLLLPHDSIAATYSIWLLYNVAKLALATDRNKHGTAADEEAPVAVTKVAQTLPGTYSLLSLFLSPSLPLLPAPATGSSAGETLPTNEFLI